MRATTRINLGNNHIVSVYSDTFDRLRLGSFTWKAQVHKRGGHVYAVSYRGEPVYMHRIITGARKGQVVDHIDGDGLNNLDQNLRIVTIGQNRANSRKPRTNQSGFKGVSWSKTSKKWVAQIVVKGNRHYLGVFEHKERAAKAHDRAALHYHGEHAGLNFEHLRHVYNDCHPERV